MPRSLLALKDRYERKKIENVSSDDQDEQEVDVEGETFFYHPILRDLKRKCNCRKFVLLIIKIMQT